MIWEEQIYTVNCPSLLFYAKKYSPGWVDGWVGGLWNWVKDYLQQSKIDVECETF